MGLAPQILNYGFWSHKGQNYPDFSYINGINVLEEKKPEEPKNL